MRGNRYTSPISKQSGFTYVALLIAVAVSGAGLAAVGELASHGQQREKEAELMFIGQQYRDAIASYYHRAPGGNKVYPKKLEELLKDNRFATTQRHLRKPYADPVTGKAEWALIPSPDGGIMGVHSLSQAQPVKSGGFDKAEETFADAKSYSDWKFFFENELANLPPPDRPNGLAASHSGNTIR